jgi:GT2 family glycosyltransferase
VNGPGARLRAAEGRALGTASPWVAAIVVNWNGAGETIACLDSLSHSRGVACRVYVVDNASRDGSAARIATAHPAATIVRAPRNLGYAGALNLGWAQALADGAGYVWFLNNDVLVEPHTLARLVEADRAWGPGIYSSKILYRDRPELVWYAGGYLDWNLKSHHLGLGQPDGEGQDTTVHRVAWASGCALFCSTDVLRHVGPLDERYFLYLEDVDWCLQAGKRGVPTYLVPDSRLYHGISRSVERLDQRLVRYYAWRNYYLLVRRHGRWWQRLYGAADLASRFVKIALRQAFFPEYRFDALYHARTRGLMDCVLGRFGQGRLPGGPPPRVERQHEGSAA